MVMVIVRLLCLRLIVGLGDRGGDDDERDRGGKDHVLDGTVAERLERLKGGVGVTLPDLVELAKGKGHLGKYSEGARGV